jgi:hypothetical protein
MRIIIDGKGTLLSAPEEFALLLERNRVRCLVNGDHDDVYGINNLVDGGTYRLGDPIQQEGPPSSSLPLCTCSWAYAQ